MRLTNVDELLEIARPFLKRAGGVGVFSREVMEHFDDFVRRNADNLEEALPQWEKKVADDLGENLPKGARQFFRSNTFKIMTDPRNLQTLSDFGKKFSDELVNSSSALGKADVSFEMRQLAKDLNFSQGVADDLLKPLENYCTDIIERRNNLIEAIAKRDFGGTSEAALRQARGKFHDMMEAKAASRAANAPSPAPGAVAAGAADETAAAADNAGAKIDAKTVQQTGDNVASGPRPIDPDTGILGNQHGSTTIFSSAASGLKWAFNKTVGKPVKALWEEGKYLIKVRPEDARFETVKEVGLYQRTVGGAMNWAVSAMEPFATTRGIAPFVKKASQMAPFKSFPNWLNAGEKFIKHRINSLDDVLEKSGAFKSIAELESNMRKAIKAIDNRQPFEFTINGQKYKLSQGITKDNIDKVLTKICDTHRAADPDFTKNLTELRKHLTDWKDFVENKMHVVEKYSWRKGCTADMQEHELRVINQFSDTVDRLLGKPNIPRDDFLKQMTDEIAAMRKAGRTADDMSATLEQMTISTVSEMGEQHKVRTQGLYFKHADDGSFEGVDIKDFSNGKKEDNYLRRFGLMKSIEQAAVLEKAETIVPGDFGRRNAGKVIGVADQYWKYVKDGKFTEWSSTGRNDYPGQLEEFYTFGRAGRIVVNQCLEYLSLARGAADWDTVPKDLAKTLDKSAISAASRGDNNYAQFLTNMARKSELVGDSGTKGGERYIWREYAAKRERLRLTDITERQVVSSGPSRSVGTWLARWGGQSGPAAEELWKQTYRSALRRTQWLLGRRATEEGAWKIKDMSWGIKEAKGFWGKSAATVNGLIIRPLITNPLKMLDPRTTATSYFFPVKVGSLYAAGAIWATASTGLSVGQYKFTPPEQRENGAAYVTKLAANALQKTTCLPMQAVRLYAKGHSLLTDNTAGWLIRGNNDGKDLTAFWRDTAQVEGNGGLIPYDKLLEKYVIGMGGSVVNGYLKDMELNDEAKQQLEALKPQDRKPDGNLPTFFNQKSTPTGGSGQQNYFNTAPTTPAKGSTQQLPSGGSKTISFLDNTGDGKESMRTFFSEAALESLKKNGINVQFSNASAGLKINTDGTLTIARNDTDDPGTESDLTV